MVLSNEVLYIQALASATDKGKHIVCELLLIRALFFAPDNNRDWLSGSSGGFDDEIFIFAAICRGFLFRPNEDLCFG